jgi:hypothetical protein
MVSPRGLRGLEVACSTVVWLLVASLAGVGWHMATRPAPQALATAGTLSLTLGAEPEGNRHVLPPSSEYAALWQRDLQQRPIPPPPEPEKPPEPPKPPPPLPKLLGTFFEGNDAWAHLVTATGGTRLVRTGDVINTYRLVAIEPGRVQLQGSRSVQWVEVPKPKPVIAERP